MAALPRAGHELATETEDSSTRLHLAGASRRNGPNPRAQTANSPASHVTLTKKPRPERVARYKQPVPATVVIT